MSEHISAALLAALSIALGLAGAARAEAPAPSFVLVAADAWLYQAPSATAERLSLERLPGDDRPRTGHALPMRMELVADQGAWLEVANPHDSGQCLDAPGALAPYQLRLFVQRDALVPVVTHDVVFSDPKGTVTVKAGRWAPRDDRRISVGGAIRTIPDDHIGWRYTASSLAPARRDLTYYVKPNAVYHKGAAPPDGGGQTMAVIAFTALADRLGFADVTLRNRCEEHTRTVRVVGNPPQKTFLSSLGHGGNDALVGAFDVTGDGPAPITIRRDATVSWPPPAALEVTPKARITGGTLSREQGAGKIDDQAVAKVFMRRKSAVQYCYEKALQRDAAVRGKITLRFTIDPTGRISDLASTENTTGQSSLADCIIGKVRAWRFDPVEGGSVTFSYPFELTTN